ncbi:MAG: hypothetical protein IKP63_01375, partial [Paludibacteraceae bacterium]|nr:hypothetical protein [Paludibacteraceae bacterium]
FLKNGNVYSIKLEDKPVIKAVGFNMVVTSSTSAFQQMEFPFISVVKITIDHTPTSISTPDIQTTSSDEICIYTMNGTLVRRSSGGSMSVDGLPQGIYVVRQGNYSYKISVR